MKRFGSQFGFQYGSALAFNPKRVPGLRLWLDAEDLQKAGLGYEASVTSWTDRINGWTATQATGTNQPRFLPHNGRNYVRLPGISGNYVGTPNSAALNFGEDIDIHVQAILPSWTSAPADRALISRRALSAQINFQFYVSASTGRLSFAYGDPTATNVRVLTAGVNSPFAAGAIGWVRVTRVSSTGQVIFYTSNDGQNWSQLGLAISGTAENRWVGSAGCELGSFASGASNLLVGGILRARVYSGIAGTLVADFDASRGNGNSSAIVATTGETWTVNRSGSDPAMIVSAPQILAIVDDYMDMSAGALGLLQNVSGETMLATRMLTGTSSERRILAVSQGTGGFGVRSDLAINASNNTQIGGRRLDTDSSQSIAGSAAAANLHAIQGGRINYGAALGANFLNGAVSGTEQAMLTAGSTSNTASTQIRIGSNNSATAGVQFFQGVISAILVYNRALTNAEILQVSKYLANRSGGAISI